MGSRLIEVTQQLTQSQLIYHQSTTAKLDDSNTCPFKIIKNVSLS